MVTYSSDQFYRDWRYAIEKDFVDPNGKAFEYSESGRQSWGDETKCLKFDEVPEVAAISHKANFLAVAVDHDIHVFDSNFHPFRILRGHASRIDCLAFRPGNNEMLVSCAMNNRVSTIPTDPTIIFWDLNTGNRKGPDFTDDGITDVGRYAALAVTQRLAELTPPVHLVSTEQDLLATEFKPVVSRIIARSNVSDNVQIFGRLQSSFQSNIFSPSGKYMLYLPGKAPKSNGDDQWDVKVYSIDEHMDCLTLTGHRDALMWMGYNSTETLIGTVAWDQTMKIWDATTGEVKYTFHTTGQNWTGGFSSDSKMFAGTCGDGTVHVYSLDDGSELLKHDYGQQWCRALAWSPVDNVLAVGGQNGGKVILIDVKQDQVVQERKLSTRKMKVEHEDVRRFLSSYLEVYRLQFINGGKELVHFTSGDGSAEIYDLTNYRKWRFARAGTESYSDTGTAPAEVDEDLAKVSSRGGFGMEVWDDIENEKVLLATVDGDGVRIWSVNF